jgi:Glycosyl transferase family 2
MRPPTVSVVMSVYNGGPFLEEAVSSIRAQTFDDFEFVIVDDGSTDESPATLARHAAIDRRLKVLQQPNRGLIAALNRGLAVASGSYVARMDADDVAKPHRLSLQVDALSRNAKLVAVGSSYEVIDQGGRVVSEVDLPIEAASIREILANSRNCMAHPTIMMRRDAVLGVGGYRRAYLFCEDYDLWLRLSEIGDLVNIAERLVAYRHYPGKPTWAQVEQQVLSELAARAAAKRRREGATDPTGDADQITPAVLRSLGVESSVMRFEIMRRALQSARRARGAGDRASARKALDLARSQKRSGAYEHAYYLLMWAKVYL